MRHQSKRVVLVALSLAAITAAACGAKPAAVVPRAAPPTVHAPGATPSSASPSSAPPVSTGTVVHLVSRAGVTTIALKGGRWTAADAVAAPDWSMVFSVHGNRLRSLNGVTGAVEASQVVRPNLRPVVSSTDGRFVALTDTPVRVGQGVLPSGRSHSTIVVAPTHPGIGIQARTIELDGNIVPEGFSTDSASLFAIEFLPALHPDRYRVRSLDIASGVIGPVFTYDKVPDTEVMQGLSRTQVFSATGPFGPMLYTLYSRAGSPAGYGELHALSLNGFVHCTDLPPSLQIGPAGGAVAVSPDGQRVYVANAEGAVAEIDASGSSQLFSIAHTTQLHSNPGMRTVALTADDHTVWVGLGSRLVGLDATDLHQVATIMVSQPVQALAIKARQTLYVATSAALEVIDPATGAVTSVTGIDTAPTRLAVA
jgi:hypothetical protein